MQAGVNPWRAIDAWKQATPFACQGVEAGGNNIKNQRSKLAKRKGFSENKWIRLAPKSELAQEEGVDFLRAPNLESQSIYIKITREFAKAIFCQIHCS